MMLLVYNRYSSFLKRFHLIALLFSLGNGAKPDLYNLQEFKDYNGRAQVTLTSDGTGYFSGPLISKSDESSFHRLRVKRDISVDGEITSRKISATQAMDASTLEVKSRLKTNSLKVSEAMEANEITVNKKLKINGIANITKGMSIVGDVSVGSLLAKHKVETRNIRVSGHVESHNVDNSDSMRSKSLEIIDTANFHGTIKGNDVEFKGEVIAKTISMNDASAKKMIISNELDIGGKIGCSGTASFSKGLHASGLVDINGDLKAKTISSKFVESESITIRGLPTKGNTVLSIPNGSIDAHDIVSKNGLETQIFHAQSAHIKNLLTGNNITAARLMVKHLDISKKAVIDSLSVENIITHKDIEIKGKAIIVGSISTKDNVVIEKNLMAEYGLFEQSLSSKDIVASNQITTRSIQVEENITSHNGRVIVNDVFAKNQVEGKIINARIINVTGELKATALHGNHITSQSVSTSNITINTSLNVIGNTTFKGHTSVNGGFDITNNVYLAENMTVSGSLETHSATISNKFATKNATINSLMITERAEIYGEFHARAGNFNKSYYGFIINPQEVLVAGLQFKVNDGNVTLNDSLFVGNTTWANNVYVSNTVQAKQVKVSETLQVVRGDIKIEKGSIFGTNGFMVQNSSVTCEDVYTKQINVTGSISSMVNITSAGTILSKDAIVSNSLFVGGISISEKVQTIDLEAGSILVDKMATVTGTMKLHNDLVMTSKSNISGVGKIDSKDAVIQNSLKAKSIFGKRIYTTDMAASGTISAESITSKGDVEISGSIIGSDINVKKKVIASSMDITNHISCSTAQIESNLDVGGVTTRKLIVNGNVMVNGVEVERKLQELDELRKRVSDLEAIIKAL